MKSKKSYRGQRNYKDARYNGCGCFYCTGYNKEQLRKKRERQILRETKQIIKESEINEQ